MYLRKFVFVFAAMLCLAGAAAGQSIEDATSIPLMVEKGFPLQLFLTEKLQFKENQPVHATVIEPVYAFDRVVIPSGSKVEGTITAFQKTSKWKKISRILSGDFTPIRQPEIVFQTLVLLDGTRIPIETSVAPGADRIIGSNGKQEPAALKDTLVPSARPSGKERVTGVLWGLAPYHPQYLPLGTRLSAMLLQPLDFGEAVFQDGELDKIGSEPPFDSIVSVRLTTPLNSRNARRGASVEAVTLRPLFSDDHRLILPTGSVLRGTVTSATKAKSRHRHGELAFNFTTVAPPPSLAEPVSIKGSVDSAYVTRDMKYLRIDETGKAHIVESKKRFIAPAWAAIKAGTSLNNTADTFDDALLGAYRGKFLKQFTGSGSSSGFGLPASITGAMFPPVGIALSVQSLARSLYSAFLGRGQDVNVPVNTEMEIRLEKVTPAR